MGEGRETGDTEKDIERVTEGDRDWVRDPEPLKDPGSLIPLSRNVVRNER